MGWRALFAVRLFVGLDTLDLRRGCVSGRGGVGSGGGSRRGRFVGRLSLLGGLG